LTSEFTEKINQNTIHLFKCLILLYNLLVNTPEGLEEASETIEKIVEYYKDYEFHSQQTSFTQEQNVTQATMLPSKVRPPLVLDLD
jgi:outer membrane lipoprotein-sorting protein